MKLKLIFAIGSILAVFNGGGAIAQSVNFTQQWTCGDAKWSLPGTIVDGHHHEVYDFLNDKKQRVVDTYDLTIDKNSKVTLQEDHAPDNVLKNRVVVTGKLSADHLSANLSGYGSPVDSPESKFLCSVNLAFVSDPSHKTQLLSDVLIKDVDLSGSITCSPPSPWKPWTSVIRGKLNGGYFSQKGGVGDSHGNTATMNVDKSSLTFEWSFHGDDGGEHHLKKKMSLAVGQVASSFSANMNFRGQQSGEDCDVKLNFAEPPLQNAQSIASPAPAVEAVTEKVTAENEVLVAQADVLISKAKSAAVRLTVQFDGFKKLQDSVRKEFQDNINSSIKDIEEKISTLSSAKETKANSDQINQLRSELNDLKNKKLADDPSFQSLVGKLAAVRKEAADNDAALKAQMEINNIKLDAQRVNDIKETDAKLSGLSIQMSDYQNKFEADLVAFQSGNDQRFNQIATNIDNLNARTAELEKNQKTLANNQVTLAVKQANTDARLDGIFLPKSENPPDWISRLSSIPVQQNQFCRIVDRFYDDLSNVYKLRNDIKKNALYKDRQQDMAALLPNGAINSWIVRVVEVTQAADGSAAIMLQPPCRAMLGSDACGTDQKKFRATIQPDTLMYRELARVNSGDFVTISGTILYAQAMSSSSVLPQYSLYEPNKHCSTIDGAKEEDVFVTEITNIAILR